MARNLVVLALLFSFAGLASLTGLFFLPYRRNEKNGKYLERQCFARLLGPCLPIMFVLTALFTWALLDPDEEEVVPASILISGGAFAVVWFRAVLRSAGAMLNTHNNAPVAVVGFLSPKIVISQRFINAVEASVLAAAKMHEEAHQRSFDPLRILVAQFITDLQWPIPSARRRFSAWLSALEIARDEDARLQGADGADLAAAILAAAKLSKQTKHAIATMSGGELQERISRLLAPLEDRDQAHTPWMGPALVLLVLLAVLCGAFFGEETIRGVLSLV